MVDILKQKLDLKTVITSLIFIIGIVASRLSNDYETKIALLKQSNEIKLEINDLKKDVEFLKEKIK